MKNQNAAKDANNTKATGTTMAGIRVLRFEEEDFEEEAVVEKLAAADVAEEDSWEDLVEGVEAEAVSAASDAESVIDIVVATTVAAGV